MSCQALGAAPARAALNLLIAEQSVKVESRQGVIPHESSRVRPPLAARANLTRNLVELRRRAYQSADK